MPTKSYDTIVIGAGIAGAATAYFLTKLGQKVLVLDKGGIASGGSGAAGAFVSPKIGVSSPLKDLTDDAFAFAYSFYSDYFPDHYHATGIVRIPKNSTDAAKIPHYSQFHKTKNEILDPKQLSKLHINSIFEGTLFNEAGACDTVPLCKALLYGIDFELIDAQDIDFIDGKWQVEGFKATSLVLATGYENDLFNMKYMGTKGTWGNRADFSSSLPLALTLHENLSISANMDGIIKLGATHELDVKEAKPCDASKAMELKDSASRLIDTSDFELVKMYCGMRSGSRDFAPVVGRVVDVASMLEYSNILNGRKYPIKYIDNLFVLNGLGARGFVLAPYLANELASYIVNGAEIDNRVNPDRLFWNWVRKQK
ncbi:MAG: FAD-dependent oxidoreductase [Sulfurovaceae bacterium]|nr:FAD-dependent oxidoreductase [Sulfurovaceae bacterium]